jgi:tetratricopeptide (TPR) repeat protein
VEELEPLFRRVLELDRAAVRSDPRDPGFNAELALALGDQGIFFLETGRGSQAEAALREALEIDRRVIASGQRKGSSERYAARNFVHLGMILAAAGQPREAVQSYEQAVKLLEPLVEELPESPIRRADLAKALVGLAYLLKDDGRLRESEEIRRRVIGLYETLKAEVPEDRQYKRNLVQSYLSLVSLLCDLNRQSEAGELYHKALELAAEDHNVNNSLAWFLATSSEPRFRNPALALELAKKAVTVRPRIGEYRNTLGVAHYRNGDYRAAIAELEESMKMRSGGDSFDWFFLAMAHWRLGDHDKARKWFDQAVQWMANRKPNDELRRFRTEAETLLAETGER